MKSKIKITLQLILTLAAFAAINSCENRSCKNVACPGNQTCYNGQCQCEPGYEGELCDQYTYEKYANRTYRVTENCTTSTQGSLNQSYTSTWYQTNRIDVVQIGNLGNQGFNVDATIASATTLYIPSQKLGGLEFYGQGEYNEYNRTITLDYQYSSLGYLSKCTAYFTPY